MAFRRSALLEIGGFDERFRVAGDDVDVCWSLQKQGRKLGFSPAAVVWHHRRSTIRGYWRQQRGYGRAEALLEQKWPEKYNAAGHVSWAGRVYGNGFFTVFPHAGRIYQGQWGTAPFQTVVLVKDGNVIYSPAPAGQVMSFTYQDQTLAKGKTSYYYVRGLQTDGQIVWVSPMWVTLQ